MRLPAAGDAWEKLASFIEARSGPLAAAAQSVRVGRADPYTISDARGCQALVVEAAKEIQDEIRARVAEGREFVLMPADNGGDPRATPLILSPTVEMAAGVDDEGEFTYAVFVAGFPELLQNLATWRHEIRREDVLLVPLAVISDDDTYPDGAIRETWVDLGWTQELVARPVRESVPS